MKAKNVYEPGRLISSEDLLDAVYDFVVAYAKPDLDPDNVIRGWENRSHLPATTQDYAVITAISSVRVGSNVVIDRYGVEGYEDDEQTIATLRHVTAQIDFCSTDHKAHQRAACIEVLARDAVGSAFFNDRNLSCLYAENITSVDYQDGTKQQIHRNIVELHLSGWFQITVSVPHAVVITPRIEDVDAFHPVISRGE